MKKHILLIMTLLMIGSLSATTCSAAETEDLQDKTAEYTLVPGEMTKTIPATKEAFAKYFAGYLIHHDTALETNAWGEEVEIPGSNAFFLVQRETDDNCYVNCLNGFAAEIEVHYLYSGNEYSEVMTVDCTFAEDHKFEYYSGLWNLSWGDPEDFKLYGIKILRTTGEFELIHKDTVVIRENGKDENDLNYEQITAEWDDPNTGLIGKSFRIYDTNVELGIE